MARHTATLFVLLKRHVSLCVVFSRPKIMKKVKPWHISTNWNVHLDTAQTAQRRFLHELSHTDIVFVNRFTDL